MTTRSPIINPERFLADLDALRRIGKVSTGVVRPAFSDADIAARRWTAARMAEIGLAPRFDPFGNLFGLPSSEGPWLLCGSHTDSQPEGGWLDGALGVCAALEAARALQEAGAPPIAVANFQDEEGRFGGLTGSRYFTGALSLAQVDALTDADGAAAGALRRAIPELASAEPVAPSQFTGFVEAHIEQGLELIATGRKLAVVDRIVGAYERPVRFIGEQNHAGTTRMGRRKDAVRGFVRFSAALDAALGDIAAPATVWTIGRIEVRPNAASIVPGEAEIVVQWRDAEADWLTRIDAIVCAQAEHAAREAGLDVEIGPLSRIEPSAMDPGFVSAAEAAAEAAAPGAWMRLPSGAIHDAGPLSRVAPAVMLFCPSLGGISHAFGEDTAREDLVICAQAVADLCGRLTR